MGGRGKASGAGKRASTIASSLNFADPGAISLEQLEAADRRLAAVSTAEVAQGVEAAVHELLAAAPDDYAAREEAMTHAIAEAATEMKRRPVEERRAFSERLAPLFDQLREQAEGAST